MVCMTGRPYKGALCYQVGVRRPKCTTSHAWMMLTIATTTRVTRPTVSRTGTETDPQSITSAEVEGTLYLALSGSTMRRTSSRNGVGSSEIWDYSYYHYHDYYDYYYHCGC